MNVTKKIVLLLTTIVALITMITVDAFFSAPSRITVRYETLESIYIPNQLDDVSILYFTDLKYGTNMDENRLNKVSQSINSLSPDIIIFGGDIFDDAITSVSDETLYIVQTFFDGLEAPLGKFAVLGDTDNITDTRATQVNQILYDAGFEVINNQAIHLRNNGSQAITLVGLENSVNGYADISNVYSNVSPVSYTITVCHTPDTAANVPTDRTKYFLSGHSLAGQAYWFFGSLYTPQGAEFYFRGKHEIEDSFTLDISSGVGTTQDDVRLFSNTEIVLYRLEHKAITIEE